MKWFQVSVHSFEFEINDGYPWSPSSEKTTKSSYTDYDDVLKKVSKYDVICESEKDIIEELKWTLESDTGWHILKVDVDIEEIK